MRLGVEYRRIWAGSACSNLVDGVTFVAIPLVAASLTRDPVLIAGLDVAYAVPRLLLVLGIGVAVDRYDRRVLLYLSHLGLAAIFLLLAVAELAGRASLPLLYASFGAAGLIRTLADSATFAIVPRAVPGPVLDRANSQLSATQLVADEFVGPRQRIVPAELMGRVGAVGRLMGLAGLAAGALTGGWLAHAFGLRVPFAVSAGLFALAALVAAVTLRGRYAREGGVPAPDVGAATASR